LNVDGIALPHA